MCEHIFSQVVGVPEHSITLHAPAIFIKKYLRFYIYSFLDRREILNDRGYVQEIFEGKIMNIPRDMACRMYIETTIANMRARIEDGKVCACCFFIYSMECPGMVERWVFRFNTKYDVDSHPLPTLNDIMAELIIKITCLPRLGIPCTYRSFMIQ